MNLKAVIIKRAVQARQLSISLSDKSKVDKKILKELKEASDRLLVIEQQVIPSYRNTFLDLNRYNLLLAQILSRVWTSLEKNPEILNNPKIENMRYYLEALGNRIIISKRLYNDTCKELKKETLMIDEDEDERSPEVKF